MTNILLITLDQFRADALSIAGHRVVQTPSLDELAAAGVRCERHYSQAAPCSPGRASIYTGMYQFNHRVVANGTPLDQRFDNLALAARRAGYEPTLFGYTDQSVDPRTVAGADDPRLEHFEGILPGFTAELALIRDLAPWRAWLAAQDHDAGSTAHEALSTEPLRGAELSLSAFMTDRAIEWMERQDGAWFAHLSYLRPHPPYAAAGEFSKRYRAEDMPEPIAAGQNRHRLHDLLLDHPRVKAPTDVAQMRSLMTQYFGMISEVDHQLGRLWEALRRLGAWEDTVIVLTSDHGEQLGDHGLIEKVGYFEQSYHIPGIIRDPRFPDTHGTTITSFTENVDVFPTICEAIGLEVPAQCDGLPLTPFLRGEPPPWWRSAAHWEYDWRDVFIGAGGHSWPWDRRLEDHHLAVLRTDEFAYVQFGDASWRCLDLANDPSGGTTTVDPAVVLPLAQEMLLWRSRHTDRNLADCLIDHGVRGRPPVVQPPMVTRLT